MILNKVTETIKTHSLIEKGEHIIIGLSGGPDSVCLFDVLMRLASSMNIKIHPVHVNHKFRPGDAERDQKYVEELCKERGISCKSQEVDCVEMAESLKITSEEAGRKARYDAFYQRAMDICREYKIDSQHVKIAVAHNADDQAETILFRLIRGTGTDGIAGISYTRHERGFSVIRPVLDVTRKEIEDYCDSRGLNPVIDHTNHEEIYTRNKIRLSLIPTIEKDFNENIKETLVRLGRIASADKDFIWQQTEAQYEKLTVARDGNKVILDRAGLSDTHPAIRHRIIMKAFGEIGLEKDISEERIKAADFIIGKKQAPKTVEFPRGYRLHVAKGQVNFLKGES